jgi:hypothetical protein
MKRTKQCSSNSHPSPEPKQNEESEPERIPRVADRRDALSTEEAFLAGAASAVLVTLAVRGVRKLIGRLDGERVQRVAYAAKAGIEQIFAAVGPNGGA